MTEKELQYHANISWAAKNHFRLWGWQWGVLLPKGAEPQDYEIVGCRRELKDNDFWPLRESFLFGGQAKIDILNKRKEIGLLTDIESLLHRDLFYSQSGTD